MKNEEWADAVTPHPDNSSFFILHSSFIFVNFIQKYYRSDTESLRSPYGASTAVLQWKADEGRWRVRGDSVPERWRLLKEK